MHMHQSCDDIWGRCQQRGGEHMDLGQARSCRGRRKPRRGGGGGGDGAKGCRSPSTFQAPRHCQGPGVTGASCCMLRPQGFVRLCALLRMTKWSVQHKALGQAANSAVCLWDFGSAMLRACSLEHSWHHWLLLRSWLCLYILLRVDSPGSWGVTFGCR